LNVGIKQRYLGDLQKMALFIKTYLAAHNFETPPVSSYLKVII
jgi:hypothetical protein